MEERRFGISYPNMTMANSRKNTHINAHPAISQLSLDMLSVLPFCAVKTRIEKRVVELLPISASLAPSMRGWPSWWPYQPVVHAVRVRSCTVAGDAEPLALLRSGATAPIALVVHCHRHRLPAEGCRRIPECPP